MPLLTNQLTWNPATSSKTFKITPIPNILNSIVAVTASNRDPSLTLDFFNSVVITRHVTATKENI